MLGMLLTELDAAPDSSLLVTHMVWEVDKALGNDLVEPPMHSFHAKPGKADRTRDVGGDEGYARLEREWAMRRGLTWTPSDARPHRLLHSLTEFATVARAHAPLLCESPTPGRYRVVYDDGTLVSFETKGDIDAKSLSIDRTLATKVHDKGLGPISDVCVVGDGLVMSFCERTTLGFVSSKLLADTTLDR